MNAARKDDRSNQGRATERAESVPAPEKAGDEPLDASARSAPPHALWQELDQWVSGRARRENPVRKLPVAARLAIIVTLSIACWTVLLWLIGLAT